MKHLDFCQLGDLNNRRLSHGSEGWTAPTRVFFLTYRWLHSHHLEPVRALLSLPCLLRILTPPRGPHIRDLS